MTTFNKRIVSPFFNIFHYDYSSLEKYTYYFSLVYNVNVNKQKFVERYSVSEHRRSTENPHYLCLERSFRLAIDMALLNFHIDETTCQGRSEGSMTLSNNKSMFDNIHLISRNNNIKKKTSTGPPLFALIVVFLSSLFTWILVFYATFPPF